ncbi:MAG: hypothetical protein Q9207_004748, partial [Kuettlingeria erythrocarpa]
MAMLSDLRQSSYGNDFSGAITRDGNERRSTAPLQEPALPRPSTRTRPPPGRRRRLSPSIRHLQLIIFSVLLLSTLCVPASGTKTHEGRRRPRYGKPAQTLPRFEYLQPDLDFFKPGDIVYDRRYPVVPVHNDVYKRQDVVDMGGSSAGGSAKTSGQKQLKFTPTSTAKPAAATTAAAFTTAVLPKSKTTSSTDAQPTSLVTAPSTESSSLPRPFDTGLGNNYTSPDCLSYMSNMLRNETFASCLPLSLLLQNSMSFFSATKSFSAVSSTLDATCAVDDGSACTTLLSSLASELRQDSRCGSDYRRQQPLVIAAYNGLVAYDPIYRAGCEKDDKGNYCFANAITNMTSPSDSYPYYLPLGIALPGGSQPTCSDCLKRTMDIFNRAANDEKSLAPLSEDYPNAAQIINVGCGPAFANQTVPANKSVGQSSFAVPALGMPPLK